MSDSVSSYYDDLEAKEEAELRERQRTVEYWRERALAAEERLRELQRAQDTLEGFRSRPLTFDPVYEK